MLNVILFENRDQHLNLLPLAYTRPIGAFRVGILTIAEKWQRRIPGRYSFLTVEALREVYRAEYAADNLFINGAVFPDEALVEAILALEEGQSLTTGNDFIIAFRGSESQFASGLTAKQNYEGAVTCIGHTFDIFRLNGEQICSDYKLLTCGRRSGRVSTDNLWLGSMEEADGSSRIFLEEGAVAEGVTFNTSAGPIYIGKDAVIQEGSLIRGPFALCDGSTVKMGAKIYAGTTIGPGCKVGGEVNNAVFFAHSNKAHDGFIGNAVVGEWCNIGAGTSASNLKNDYARIRVWNYATRSFMRTDLQFCGLIMGDHSRIGINCSLNTATVMGVGVNLHGSGFPRTFIPSFSQGTPQTGFKDIPLNTFFRMAERMMSRRNITLTDAEKRLFQHVEAETREFK